MSPSRRTVLGVTSAAALIGNAEHSIAASEEESIWLQSVLDRYIDFGVKASGGPGDEACGAWIESELGSSGYVCQRQPFEVPFFESQKSILVTGRARAGVIPQAVVVPTPSTGLSAPLRLANESGDLSGAIAVVVLPYKRWATLADPQAARPLADAFNRGAAAAVVVTNGPSQEAIALNVNQHKTAALRPVAILAPRDAAPFFAAAAKGNLGKLTIDGQGGRRTAYNLIARSERKASKTLILSTPRSGWFGCAAERGSGLAVWLFMAKWLAHANYPVNIELLATSGHEYEYEGGEQYLHGNPPTPAKTKLWIHIGASAAARDWHELGPALLPLPSADSQRVLTSSTALLESTRSAFKGIAGLEAVYVADRAMAGGELVSVLNAGYTSLLGLYGAHRYFHTRSDDLRCVSADLVLPVAKAYRAAVEAFFA